MSSRCTRMIDFTTSLALATALAGLIIPWRLSRAITTAYQSTSGTTDLSQPSTSSTTQQEAKEPMSIATKRKVACHISWDDIQQALLYCELIRERIGLVDWGIGISVDPCEEGAHASIESYAGKRFATVFLSVDWTNKAKHLKRSTLLHEMVHLLHQRQAHAIEAVVKYQTDLSQDRSEVIMSSYWRESEYMVDGIATALARVDGFLPKWPTKAEARKRNLDNREP